MDDNEYKQSGISEPSVEQTQAYFEDLLFGHEISDLPLRNRLNKLFVEIGREYSPEAEEDFKAHYRRLDREFTKFFAEKLVPLVNSMDVYGVRTMMERCINKFNKFNNNGLYSREFGHNQKKDCSVAAIVDVIGAKLGIKAHGAIFQRLHKFERRLDQFQSALLELESRRKILSPTQCVTLRIRTLFGHLKRPLDSDGNCLLQIQTLARAIAPDEYVACLWDPLWIPGDEPFTWEVAARHLGCAADAPVQAFVKALGSVDPELCAFDERSPEALLALRLKIDEFIFNLEIPAFFLRPEIEVPTSAVERLGQIAIKSYVEAPPSFDDLLDGYHQVCCHLFDLRKSPFAVDF